MFTQHGFVTLISPSAGPVNLYRTSRVANWKQRVMLAAETNTCAWPGCHHPVEDCQIHHIIPWVEGGQTNIENLAPLCPYHNGVNDDHREGRRGHIDRKDGKIVWIPPWANGILTSHKEADTTQETTCSSNKSADYTQNTGSGGKAGSGAERGMSQVIRK